MKRNRTFRILVCLVTVWALLCAAGFAVSDPEGAGYEITDCHIDTVIHENNTYSVREQRTVNFLEEMHGLERRIPQRFTRKDGMNYNYYTPISEIDVRSHPFEIEYADENTVIRMGDEDKTVIGEKKYDLSFLLDYGEDWISEYDFIHHNIVGTEGDCVIDRLTFTVRVEKDVDLSDYVCHIYAGESGSADESRVRYTIDKNVIAGTVEGGLQPYEALTLDIRLPEGFFAGERTPNMYPIYIGIAVLIALQFVMLVRFARRKQPKIQELGCCMPPEGITSADAGYYMDGSADRKDMLSLILWFADKGYLSVYSHGDDIWLKKEKPLSAEQPWYACLLFGALFEKSDMICLYELDERFGKTFIKAEERLIKQGKKLLLNQKTERWNTGAAVVISLIVLILLQFCRANKMNVLFACINCLLVRTYAEGFKLKYFHKRTTLIGWTAAAAAFLGTVSAWVVMEMLGSVPVWTSAVICAVGALDSIAVQMYYEITPYGAEMIGKLLGLRSFIRDAQPEQIRCMMMQQPDYCYTILPYAYIFDLDREWLNKLETMNISLPGWYHGGERFKADLNQLYIAYRMVHLHVQHTAEKASASGGAGGGGGGGGTAGW